MERIVELVIALWSRVLDLFFDLWRFGWQRGLLLVVGVVGLVLVTVWLVNRAGRIASHKH